MNVAPLSQDLFGAAAASDGTYEYVFGGYSFTAVATLNTVQRYDLATDTWTMLAPLPTREIVASAVYYPPTNKIYVFGGSQRDEQIVLDTTQIYDIATNTLVGGCDDACAAQPDGVRLQPGEREDLLERRVRDGVHRQRLEPDVGVRPGGEHVHREDAEPERFRAARLPGSSNGHLLMAGGRTNPDATLDLTWDYDIAADTWTQRQSLPTPKNVSGGAVAQGQLWSIGGGNPFTPFTTTDVVSFDPGANTWNAQPSLIAQRSFTASAAVGNTLIAAGGRDGASTSLSSVEKLVLGGPPPPRHRRRRRHRRLRHRRLLRLRRLRLHLRLRRLHHRLRRLRLTACRLRHLRRRHHHLRHRLLRLRLRLPLRHRLLRHRLASAASASASAAAAAASAAAASSASAAAASAGPLPRPTRARAAPGGREAKDPGEALLGRPSAQGSLQAGATGPRDQAVAAAWIASKARVPGEARGWPALGDLPSGSNRAPAHSGRPSLWRTDALELGRRRL